MAPSPTQLGLLALQLGSGEILHASEGFVDIGKWTYPEGLASHFIRPLLHPEDAHAFQAFMNQQLLDLKKWGGGDPVGFAAANLVGRTVSARMLRRPQGPAGARSPWAVVVTSRFTFTIASIQVLPGEEGRERVVAALVTDLREKEDTEVPLHVAHVRNLIQAGTYNTKAVEFEWDTDGMEPFDMFGVWMFGPTVRENFQDHHDHSSGNSSSFLPTILRYAINATKWMFQKAISMEAIGSYRFDQEGTLTCKSNFFVNVPEPPGG
mmetsp:Transcript_28372/g.66048  ORF Transcript_28372/g.66048 Transcript_28372/m.66048 type:complete len:265 (-) Transcript_28372:449-1243(-)